ncbi:methyltransferase domain protein [Selenomonas sp. FOBRC6]|uniref:class I SAM-dependent DNA methyltransferase n=1 Tax=Selenomonas sp. FOBRC6 TaxID=936572 RepID=UPI00027823AA|nr:DNA methyltransferase [Selenomonas sp. FOBRC6]EJO21217.1 methyltransferase domain protein [Selenomonas sp. FOBRC6]
MIESGAQQKAAKAFAAKWKGRGYEKGESQKFWMELLQTVYGVANPADILVFEQQVMLDHTSFIDVMIPSTHVMIEQKSLGKSLTEPIKQSDGTYLKPIEQARRYAAALPYSARPRWIVSSNFAQFLIYDMETPNAEPQEILLENLEREAYRLNFLVDVGDEHIAKEMEVSIKAGELVGRLYDALAKEYRDMTNPHSQQSLNILCVRLVFALYAEDAGLFGRHAMFHDYLRSVSLAQFRSTLIELFRVLDTPIEERDPYLHESLAAFPYVNGGLFAETDIEIPQFTQEIVDILLDDASAGFDWSAISPTIFGAVFESTLNPATRRAGGMHYTSIENIHKVIDPLFLDALRDELEACKAKKTETARRKALLDFQEKLAAGRYFDPAAGSGNFLTETYLSLRRLENEVLRELSGVKVFLGGIDNPVKVSIGQFYGIEINDFAVTVARTALWIAESQMMKETESIVHMTLDFLPLRTYDNIHEGNALRMDWREILPPTDNVRVMGNPPFVGARIMQAGSSQKEDVASVFAGWKNVGNLDYVCCWYKRAADYMVGTNICAAFVSTNSVTQGDSVATLWKPLFANGISIHFAHRTFIWDSESNSKAHVYCVIVGFGYEKPDAPIIYTNGQVTHIKHINAYLVDAVDVFIENRNKTLCDVPKIGIGCQPIDNGQYLFTEEEKDEFLAKEPKAAPYFKEWYGAQEFIHRKPRYCLWLSACTPHELRQLPLCRARVEAVREFRLKSPRAATRKLADKPANYTEARQSASDYILIPRHSSENRRYIPMGFLPATTICGDANMIVPDATLYHFGILTSNVHMAWTRAVCGRLKSDYRYSKSIVYNNFPWCDPTPEQKAAIAQTAQGILDARALYPESSFADLYDDVVMPPELREAHRANDRAVMRAYGFSTKLSESECVAELMKRYEQLVQADT